MTTDELIEDMRVTIEHRIAEAVAVERERCVQIALAIDSKRGNEKEIARAIRAQTQ